MSQMKGWMSGLSRRTLMIGGTVVLVLVLGAVAVIAAEYLLLNQGEVHQIDEAVYRSYTPADATGSGTFDAFVRISANTAIEKGYNSDGRPLEFDENTSPSFTRSYRLSNIPIVEDPDYPGVYREFQLDINQTAGQNISLDEVEVYLTTDPNLLGYPFAGTAEKVYELDKVGSDPAGDNWVVLNYDLAAGSGKRDMILRIPNANFLASDLGDDPECAYSGHPPAGESCGTFVILYSQFGADGENTGNDDGFEEWGVELYDLATKSGMKFHDLDADGVKDAGEPGLSGWTIYVDINDNGSYDLGEPAAETDANGLYEITAIPFGTFKVREVAQAGWTCSFPANCYYEETFEQGGVYENNDFGNYQMASKSGMKFDDLNANGAKDAGEPGVAGVPIHLFGTDGMGNAVNQLATTAGDGSYSFDVAPGNYTVCEILYKDGVVDLTAWTQSYPAAGADCSAFDAAHDAIHGPVGYSIELTSGESETDNDFGNYLMASKSGIKFDDLNANGAKDAGEPGVAGVPIHLFGTDGMGNAVSQLATTAGDGSYSFDVAPGSYTVCEILYKDGLVDLTAWTQSYPAAGADCSAFDAAHDAIHGPVGYSIELTSGESETDNDFGNYLMASKSGIKFDDLNANGAKDAGEPGVAGVPIHLFGTDGMGNAVNQLATTAGDGSYSFDVAPGNYTVCEILYKDGLVDLTAWTQSYPAAGADCSAFDAAHDAIHGPVGYSIELTSGESETDNDFGNYLMASKSGMKFDDLNANGAKDAGEPGVAGVPIHLFGTDGMGNAVNQLATTAGDGSYSFDVAPGNYTVCEILYKDGLVDLTAWTQSYPAAGADCSAFDAAHDAIHGPVGYSIELTSGESETDNDFGNYLRAKKSGYKWHDLNADGVWDAGEPGLEDWVIELWDGSGKLAEAMTDANGYYEFGNLDPGDYMVCEQLPGGWTQSYPTSGFACPGGLGLGEFGYAFTLTSGQHEQDNDFGNWMYATKSGYKYEDMNADGDLSDGVPVDGVTIYLIDAATDTIVDSEVTAGGGYYEFNMVMPGVDYLVCEQDLSPDWTQSYPANNVCAAVAAAAVEAGGHAINLSSGEADEGNDFGNWRYAYKRGMKFEDLNANGQKDAGEPGVAGVEICADGTCTTTDANGNYELMLAPGSYLVCEEDVSASGWTQSYPANNVCAGVAGAAPGGWDITLVSNQVDEGNDFGNWRYATKSGYKWLDLNANAAWEGGEPALSGWTIDLLLSDGTFVASTTTDANGYYEFDMVVPNVDYVVCEVLELGWYQSFPTATADCTAFGAQYGPWGYQINLMSGEVEADNNFGNYEEIGCTLTQGYWKTHADPARKQYDATWDKVGGPDAPFFDTGQSYLEVMDTPPAGGNAYYILAHQYIAAILNSLKDDNPASTSAITAELAQAAALLDFYDTYPGGPDIPAEGAEFSSNDRELAISLAGTLDMFNNGELPGGPPHCE